jgi:hypothetical protein
MYFNSLISITAHLHLRGKFFKFRRKPADSFSNKASKPRSMGVALIYSVERNGGSDPDTSG